jgi:MFS family permease
MMAARKKKEQVLEATMMFMVAAASLFLLLYVGYCDGRRTYETSYIEKATSEGRYLQNAMEKFLRDGLPLRQYAGFSTIAKRVVGSEDVDALIVYDEKGRELFKEIDKLHPVLPKPAPLIGVPGDQINVYYGRDHYQIVIPLRSKFEKAGSVVVVAPTSLVTNKMYASFLPLVPLAILLSVLFAVIIVFSKPYFARPKKPWLHITYAMTFLLMAIAVSATLVGLYFDGIEGKARQSAFTLSQRLNDVIQFRLSFKDISGIDRAFQDYRDLNPDISEASLLIDDTIRISTNLPQVGQKWSENSNRFSYRIDLSPPDKPQYTSLVVEVPKTVVLERIGRNVKNFVALFIATAFLSGLFLQVAESLRHLRASKVVTPEEKETESATGLVIIMPAYFLAVFLDSLTSAFLPKFMQLAAVASNLSISFGSAPFTAYYLAFALSLIPAGVISDRRGSKPVIMIGLLLAAGSVFALMLPLGIWEMTILRAISGMGQGAVLIGIQSYILAVASPEKKTQGVAIIVFGFQAGLISGMALGSLLINFVGENGIFAIAGAVGAVNLVYTFFVVPNAGRAKVVAGARATVKKLADDLKSVVVNIEFLKTLLCIGVPAKAVLTGVITFALPLILGQLGYRQEDIGQLVMLYGLGVLASSGFISRLVDRTQASAMILFAGAVMSGVGLLLVGSLGSTIVGNGVFSTAVTIVAVVVVGAAHGFINAPVVSHIAYTPLAQRIGANSATTAYRFLERCGHVAGPILLSELFVFWGEGPRTIGIIGVGVLILALVFVTHRLIIQPSSLRGEPAE